MFVGYVLGVKTTDRIKIRLSDQEMESGLRIPLSHRCALFWNMQQDFVQIIINPTAHTH